MKICRLFAMTALAMMATACVFNVYNNSAYEQTDSYGSVFEGQDVPADVR